MVSKSIIEKLREIYQSLPKVEQVDKGDGWVNQYYDSYWSWTA